MSHDEAHVGVCEVRNCREDTFGLISSMRLGDYVIVLMDLHGRAIMQITDSSGRKTQVMHTLIVNSSLFMDRSPHITAGVLLAKSSLSATSGPVRTRRQKYLVLPSGEAYLPLLPLQPSNPLVGTLEPFIKAFKERQQIAVMSEMGISVSASSQLVLAFSETKEAVLVHPLLF